MQIAWQSPVGQAELVHDGSGRCVRGGDYGSVFLAKEEQVSLPFGEWVGEVSRDLFAARDQFQAGRGIYAIAARLQDGIVTAGNQHGRGLWSRRRGRAARGA